ncbi:hypothetical protein EZMO1_4179 [Endozoicomonas montiporae CL-33]|uniref:Uncharacterized protein n=1 Tax=Endozoicomonas montiporae CL-33 TaxID=570277 RepID=A0A142BH77_9GAMM|nr:hypothetical protein [Endozoicomonas montiporae]AMO58103.1 hypothetical protein EZMO1_4179 [Endozoicomonas montiporae CL-33]
MNKVLTVIRFLFTVVAAYFLLYGFKEVDFLFIVLGFLVYGFGIGLTLLVDGSLNDEGCKDRGGPTHISRY